jgi:hypothetical protein
MRTVATYGPATHRLGQCLGAMGQRGPSCLEHRGLGSAYSKMHSYETESCVQKSEKALNTPLKKGIENAYFRIYNTVFK